MNRGQNRGRGGQQKSKSATQSGTPTDNKANAPQERASSSNRASSAAGGDAAFPSSDTNAHQINTGPMQSAASSVDNHKSRNMENVEHNIPDDIGNRK